MYMYKQKQENRFSIMSILQTNCHLKLGVQKMDKDTGGNWLIHKYHKDNQLQSLNHLCILVKYMNLRIWIHIISRFFLKPFEQVELDIYIYVYLI